MRRLLAEWRAGKPVYRLRLAEDRRRAMATVERARDVRSVMLTHPETHGPGTTVGELRSFFEDDHVHVALLVDAGRLVGVVERDDLRLPLGDDEPARAIASLEGRTIRPAASLADACAAMKRDGRRRLAVTDGASVLVGLLCLKRSGRGFCSDVGVLRRRRQRGRARP
jgi:CBS domain-containing protein